MEDTGWSAGIREPTDGGTFVDIKITVRKMWDSKDLIDCPTYPHLFRYDKPEYPFAGYLTKIGADILYINGDEVYRYNCRIDKSWPTIYENKTLEALDIARSLETIYMECLL